MESDNEIKWFEVVAATATATATAAAASAAAAGLNWFELDAYAPNLRQPQAGKKVAGRSLWLSGWLT